MFVNQGLNRIQPELRASMRMNAPEITAVAVIYASIRLDLIHALVIPDSCFSLTVIPAKISMNVHSKMVINCLVTAVNASTLPAASHASVQAA